MQRIVSSIKRTALALVFVSGLAAGAVGDTASAFASGPPHVTASGNPGTGVRVYGSNFTPSNWAQVEVFDWTTGNCRYSPVGRPVLVFLLGWWWLVFRRRRIQLDRLGERDVPARLKRMRVAPERQGQGIGTRLTEIAIAWAHEHGFDALILETTLQQTAPISLYKRRGFTEVGRSALGPFKLVWFRLSLVLHCHQS